MVLSRGKNLQFTQTADQEHIPASCFKFETIAFFTALSCLNLHRCVGTGSHQRPRRRMGTCAD